MSIGMLTGLGSCFAWGSAEYLDQTPSDRGHCIGLTDEMVNQACDDRRWVATLAKSLSKITLKPTQPIIPRRFAQAGICRDVTRGYSYSKDWGIHVGGKNPRQPP